MSPYLSHDPYVLTTSIYLEELLAQLEVNVELLEETTLTKQACTRSHRTRKGNVQSYRIQSSHDEINAMEVRHFFRARYA